METSPAASHFSEHSTGVEYADYLRLVARHKDLPIHDGIDVVSVSKLRDKFLIRTAENSTHIRAKHVVWAAGEFQYPLRGGIDGFEHCVHTSTIERFHDLEGDDFIVIGGFESGIDAAWFLACRDKRVRLFDSGNPWENETNDPAYERCTYSLERMSDGRFTKNVKLHANTRIKSVEKSAKKGKTVYKVFAENGKKFETTAPPLFAGGFEGSHRLVAKLFAKRDDGFPLLSEDDESTLTPGMCCSLKNTFV